MGLFDWFTKKPAPAHAEPKTPAPAASGAVATHTRAVDEQLAGTWTLDPSHSALGFSAKHAMVTNVRGTFDEFEGTGVIDATDPSASTVSVVIQAASVNTGVADRDGHLRSGDFFDVETYPEIRFASTDVELVDAETWRITGDLTIKDVTRPVTVDFAFTGVAQDPFGNVRAGFEGETTVNRKDWGLVWNAALETGGVLVSEKVKLVFDLSVIKSA
ncbi:YceI family protein [Ornithinimicrobium tianjinense]|uniref:Polyisoprenoid-binding protein n=1 Tax=Ornithinimicrobium tianjinense TaxID=1195761 RepID=A0A917BGK6_9MICO|nr:YceI family protein [Ornithinimicrobium tianjinense]GGF44094.1 polyisoprenoid-binding protein [Ornithinimicrobium tianjinense]